MSELKTQPHDGSVTEFLNSIESETKREDSFAIKEMMEEITGAPAVMWGSSIIGFGSYHYQYKSGRSGEWFLCGFSPRKQSLTLYLMSGFDAIDSYLNKLGKHKKSKGCLYINRLTDIDLMVLKELITESVNKLRPEAD
ncbi:DUF1801 domain-containing protein [Marinoscillum furvescens]|uniref:Uncharacterized protein DUF1801 n=1 Tax=Marinoscillum furvescens DSM 4134 TaxID=1122208 RepID=A0A3D9L4M4_MARFU|nr:DUF1801 domain-containing protein [Marinoscillum furvescens]RED99755.1 uncharacterized protein DUF1801 [Marinoscillum furvescens DSM 4134]